MKKNILLLSFLIFPKFAFAQTTIQSLISDFGYLINIATPIAFGIALLYFIWGLVIFIKNSGNPDAKEEGRNKMVWGIMSLFVIVSIWGITEFIGRVLGVGPEEVRIPQIERSGSGGSS